MKAFSEKTQYASENLFSTHRGRILNFVRTASEMMEQEMFLCCA